MPLSNYEDIISFHIKYGIPESNSITKISDDVAEFRYNFMIEELDEFSKAAAMCDLAEIIDAFVDLSYVTLGTAYLYGIDIEITPTYSYTNSNPKPIPFDMAATAYLSLKQLVDLYMESHLDSDLAAVKRVLREIHLRCIEMSYKYGFAWQKHWDLVHSCNMKKVRATSSKDSRSKRNHVLDVVKPEGWVAPDHTTLF